MEGGRGGGEIKAFGPVEHLYQVGSGRKFWDPIKSIFQVKVTLAISTPSVNLITALSQSVRSLGRVQQCSQRFTSTYNQARELKDFRGQGRILFTLPPEELLRIGVSLYK